MMQGEEYIEANRRAWNEVAPIHAAANQARLLQRFAQPGFSVLDEYERAKLEQIGVAGKAVAQIGCNNGRELLSIKNMGAGRCVGFDLSEQFIEQARALNAAAQHDCEFVATNALEIPADYDQQFDLVFITIGVLSWMPDIHAFFAGVGRLLRPGGHLLIYEMHPFTTMLDLPAETETPLLITLSYFSKAATQDSGLDYYNESDYDALPHYWFTHTLGALFQAMIDSGIALAAFEEYPHDISNAFAPLEQFQKVPLSCIIVGKRI
jgi:ubiquinone/menaquinone biosynthesis C-methylase UbiE